VGEPRGEAREGVTGVQEAAIFILHHITQQTAEGFTCPLESRPAFLS